MFLVVFCRVIDVIRASGGVGEGLVLFYLFRASLFRSCGADHNFS